MMNAAFFVTSWLKGPAQVFLIGNVVTGLISSSPRFF